MSELTKRRIDISIERLTELRDQYNSASGFTADRKQFYMYRNRVAALDTALAALDAVRWRDMATEPPTYDERCRILVIFKGERGEGRPVMLTYDPVEDQYFNKFEDSHFVNTRYSSTDGMEEYGLTVWQDNIDKWRPIVW